MKKIFLGLLLFVTSIAMAKNTYLAEIKDSEARAFRAWGGTPANIANQIKHGEIAKKLSWTSYACYLLVDRAVLPWQKDLFVLSENETPKLHAMVARQAKAFDLPVPVLLLSQDKTTSNCMSIGPSHSVGFVVLFERFMEDLTDKEFEGVIAHELAHIKHRDLWKKVGVAVAAHTAAKYLAAIAGGLLIKELGSAAIAKGEETPPIGMNVPGKVLIEQRENLNSAYMLGAALGLVATIGINAYGRKLERDADLAGAYNLQQTKSLKSVFDKLAQQGAIKEQGWDKVQKMLDEADVTTIERIRITVRLFLSSKLERSWIYKRCKALLDDHPTPKERVAYLAEHEKIFAV